jgi:hypothetical protein
MDSESVKTIVTVASVLVATTSLMFNVYQFRKGRNTISPALRREDVRTSIMSIVQKIDSSMLFKVPPHHELWLEGFKSLEEARSIFATANAVISHSAVPPSDIKLTVAEILSKVNSLMRFRDSLTRVTGQKHYASPEDMDKWPQRQDAEAALHELQAFINSRETKLRDYLTILST